MSGRAALVVEPLTHAQKRRRLIAKMASAVLAGSQVSPPRRRVHGTRRIDGVRRILHGAL